MTARTLAFPTLPAARLPSTPPTWRRALAFVGPGYLVAVGYMDPGNWAVDIAGGTAARYGLLAVVLAASLAAMFVQDLVVRLTLATGRDLATLIRENLLRPLSLAVWVATEIAIVATELAALLGGAIAFKLLLGTPLIVGAAATAAITVVLIAGAVGSGVAASLFAVALLAAGQSSTITGALAGQLVMQGFLQRRLPSWLRLLGQRGAALGLAFGLLAGGGDGAGDRLLVLSQVVLSLTLPAVLLPLAWLVSGRTVSVGPARRAGAWAFALILTGLNLYLLPGLLAT